MEVFVPTFSLRLLFLVSLFVQLSCFASQADEAPFKAPYKKQKIIKWTRLVSEPCELTGFSQPQVIDRYSCRGFVIFCSKWADGTDAHYRITGKIPEHLKKKTPAGIFAYFKAEYQRQQEAKQES